MTHKVQKLSAARAGDLRALEDSRSLIDAADAQRGREHLHPVFLTRQKFCFFKPGDSRFHPRVIGRAVALKLLIPFLADDFARGGHHLARLLPVHPPQCLQDRPDLVPGQTRAGRERELPLDIVSGEEKHAICRRLIAARASGFLQVVLQRSRNIAMYDQTNIGLIDPHAKGVGRSNHPQITYSKRLLNLALAFGCQPGVEMVGRQSLPFQKLRHLFRSTARRAIDHSARRPFGRQVRLDRGQDIGQLGRLLRGQNGEGQIGPHRSAIEQHQIYPEAALEMVANVPHHFGFGRGGQAQDRGHMIAREFLDEAADIAVIRAEIMAPF